MIREMSSSAVLRESFKATSPDLDLFTDPRIANGFAI